MKNSNHFLPALVLVFLLFSVSSLACLSDEEKSILPTLPVETLVQIILTYDQGLTDAETALTELENLTSEQKIILTERVALLEQANQELTELEKQFQISYELQKKSNLKNLIIAGGLSLLTGLISGLLLSG